MEQVKKDMIDLNIECDLSQISNMSKTSFKALVKKKALQYALSKLTEKKNTYKKLENLVYDKLEPQSYLNDEKITFLLWTKYCLVFWTDRNMPGNLSVNLMKSFFFET